MVRVAWLPREEGRSGYRSRRRIRNPRWEDDLGVNATEGVGHFAVAKILEDAVLDVLLEVGREIAAGDFRVLFAESMGWASSGRRALLRRWG